MYPNEHPAHMIRRDAERMTPNARPRRRSLIDAAARATVLAAVGAFMFACAYIGGQCADARSNAEPTPYGEIGDALSIEPAP